MDSSGLYRTLTIEKIIAETADFRTIIFRDGHGIRYQAGQYLTLVTRQAGGEVRRSYSIISSPLLNEPLAIGVKRVENGLFSRLLVDMARPGDQIVTTGSGGLFTLPEKTEGFGQLFFLAAGSGITPVISLVKTALHSGFKNIVLVYSNSSRKKAVYISVLEKLEKQYEQFRLIPLFSDHPVLSRARLHRELLTGIVETSGIPEKGSIMFYICGPENYMRMCIYTLQGFGIPPKNIRRENFIIHNIPRRDSAPPDTGEYMAVLRLGGESIPVNIRYPDSILRAAQKQGLQLPYSCEAGRCGNCVARCIKGKVWHSYNEVLTERELGKGLVLTCVGHPLNGDIELEL